MNWKKSLVTVLILAVIAILLTLIMPKDGAYQTVFNAEKNAPVQNTDTNQPPQSEQVTLEGEVVCLPHRDTSGPTTLECAYGLKGDNGYYYALNTAAYSGLAGSMYEVGDRIRVQGDIEPVTDANRKQWETYDIVASILVTTFEKI